MQTRLRKEKNNLRKGPLAKEYTCAINANLFLRFELGQRPEHLGQLLQRGRVHGRRALRRHRLVSEVKNNNLKKRQLGVHFLTFKSM